LLSGPGEAIAPEMTASAAAHRCQGSARWTTSAAPQAKADATKQAVRRNLADNEVKPHSAKELPQFVDAIKHNGKELEDVSAINGHAL
jgi:hypothetical protein